MPPVSALNSVGPAQRYQSNLLRAPFLLPFRLHQQLNGQLSAGKPDIFTQAGGDFTRDLRGWELGSYAQDEYRISTNLTLNYGVRYEITTPFRDIHNRMMEFAPGQQSTAYPGAPNGLLFPDSGVPNTIAPVFKNDWAPVSLCMDPFGIAVR